MGTSGLTAVGAPLASSKTQASWTLSIAVLSTLVTVGLSALYLMLETPEFPQGRTTPCDQFAPLAAGGVPSVAS